jgi:hypothetical protein
MFVNFRNSKEKSKLLTISRAIHSLNVKWLQRVIEKLGKLVLYYETAETNGCYGIKFKILLNIFNK